MIKDNSINSNRWYSSQDYASSFPPWQMKSSQMKLKILVEETNKYISDYSRETLMWHSVEESMVSMRTAGLCVLKLHSFI